MFLRTQLICRAPFTTPLFIRQNEGISIKYLSLELLAAVQDCLFLGHHTGRRRSNQRDACRDIGANEARGAEFREQSKWDKEMTSLFVGLGWEARKCGSLLRRLSLSWLWTDALVARCWCRLKHACAVQYQAWRYAQQFRVKDCQSVRRSSSASAHTLDSM